MCVQYWSVKRRSSGEIFRITPPYLNRAESLVVVLQQNHSPALNTLGVRLPVEAPREAGGGTVVAKVFGILGVGLVTTRAPTYTSN